MTFVCVMVIAMVVAVGVMLVFAGQIGDFVHRHPSMKILALHHRFESEPPAGST